MRQILSLLILLVGSAAFAQTASTQPATNPSDVALGKQFRSRTAGIQFNPPAGGSMIRELNTGDIVRFIYSDQGWDVRVKPVPLHIPLMLSAPGDAGVLELTVNHLTDSNPTAKVLRKEVVSIRGRDVGRIEATYKAGVDHLFAQQALFKENSQYFLSVQMTSQDQGGNFNRERQIFDHVLDSVEILDRDDLAREQRRRIYETRGLWTLWDQKAITAAIQPLQFMRVVRDGREVGFIQMDQRLTNHNGHDGVEVIIHSRVEIQQRTDVPTAGIGVTPMGDAQAGGATPSPDSIGIVVPKALSPTIIATGDTVSAKAKDLYTFSTYFVSFDRDHEDWTTATQTDDKVATQITETAYTDRTIKRRLDAAKLHQQVASTQHVDDPPVIEIPKYVLNVTYTVGKHDQPPVDIQLPPFYLPQTLGQMLPRLLPPDPAQYMFAFYVSGQRNLMGRYVDVESPREVNLDGQTVRAIPITDRIGVDGAGTIDYVTRQGEWLGTVSEDSHLAVYPTDEHTLKGLWPGFVTSPLPEENNQDNTAAPSIPGQ